MNCYRDTRYRDASIVRCIVTPLRFGTTLNVWQPAGFIPSKRLGDGERCPAHFMQLLTSTRAATTCTMLACSRLFFIFKLNEPRGQR